MNKLKLNGVDVEVSIIGELFINGKKHNTYNNSGYVSTSINGKPFRVHRLVAQAYIPNPENYPIINHINGIRNDNRVENIEWCNYSHNAKHARAIGLQKDRIGENHPQAKLKEIDVLNMRYFYYSYIYSVRQLSNMFDVTISHTESIINNRTWKHI